MRDGYSYTEKIIKTNVSDEEFAYISENNEMLNGFDTKIDWVRYYPYGDVMKSILEPVFSSKKIFLASTAVEYVPDNLDVNVITNISSSSQS